MSPGEFDRLVAALDVDGGMTHLRVRPAGARA